MKEGLFVLLWFSGNGTDKTVVSPGMLMYVCPTTHSNPLGRGTAHPLEFLTVMTKEKVQPIKKGTSLKGYNKTEAVKCCML